MHRQGLGLVAPASIGVPIALTYWPRCLGGNRMARKLAAILSADVVGYSRLMGGGERGPLEGILSPRSIVNRHVAAHGGRIVDATGDALLAEFASAIE